MTINGTNQNHGIRGINASTFTLEFSTVTGTNGTSIALDEGSVNFDNLTGTAAITSCVIDGGFEDNLNVVNTSGTLNRLTISGSTFGFNSTANGNNNILIESQNAGTTLNFTLKSSLIKGARADWINYSANSSSTMDAVIGGPLVADGNNFDNLGANAHPNAAAGGNRVVGGSVGNQAVDIRNNTMKGSKGEAIRVRSTATGAVTGTVNARVRNNAIGVAGTANSGSSESFGIFVFGDGGSDMNIAITNNSVFQYNNTGINLQFGDEINDGSVFNATVTGNTVSNPGNLNTDFNGIQLNNGTVGATDNFTSCVDIGGAGVGNNVSNSGSGVTPPNNADIRLRQRQSTTVRLPGYGGANNNDAAVVTELTGRNTVVTAAASNTLPSGGRFIGGAACTSPSFAGPITQSFSSSSATSESLTMEAPATDDQAASILWATKGENDNQQHVVKLTQSELSAMVQAAIARWAEAGVSANNLAKLQALSFEIGDLPAGQLATATSSKITLDETAAGYGWFFDATPSDDNEFEVPVENKELQTTELSAADGRVDLLTVLMRQLGSRLTHGKSALKGPHAWLMEGTLGTGTRRAPALKARSIGKAQSSAPAATAKQTRAIADTEKTEKRDADYQRVAALNGPRNSRVMRNHTMRAAAPTSLADVMLNIGTLPAGKSITITFNVTVNNPFLGATAQVSNQGTVSGTNFSDVLTDDRTVGGAADPTVTPIDLQADLEVTKTDSPDPVIAGNNITYTINFKNNGPNASGATVTDATPSGTTFVSASVTTGTGWSITNPSVGGTGNVVFSKGSVADDETAVFSIVVKVGSGVAAATIITNNAVAATTGASDPVPGNNTGTATTTVIAQADLSITKTDGATTEVPGTSVSYTVTVTNSGPSDASGVTVSDTFPGILTGVTYTSVAAGGATGNTAAGSGNINDTVSLPSGGSVTYTVSASIASSATGSLSNTATVTAPAGVTDPTPGNNSATDTDTLAPSADVSVTKSDSPDPVISGHNITYSITVTNNGPIDAACLSLSDAVPANTTLVSVTTPAGWTRTDAVPTGVTGTITFTRPTLAAGASSIFTILVNVNPGPANGTIIRNN